MKSLKRLIGRPDRDDFARIVIEAIRQSGSADSIEYDPKNFRLIVRGEIHFYLTNLYEEYSRAGRRQRIDLLKTYTSAWMKTGEGKPSLEDALPNLLPVVRTSSYQDLIKLRAKAEGWPEQDVPVLDLASHLAVGLACDAPDTIRYVSQGDLSRWELSFDDALDRARDNLWARSGGKFDQPISGFYVSPWNDNYDSSRLFLHDLIWHLDVDGDHVAAVPDRDALIVTGSEDLGGLAMLAKMCENAQHSPRPLSSIPVVLQGKQWSTYSPGLGHPEFESFKKLRIMEQTRDYAEQNSLLEAWNQRTGQDVFVASYVATSNKDTGAYNSYCVWSEGVPTLLPVADQIAFVVGGKLAGTAPWDKVCAVAGHLMTSLDLRLPRFKVEDFPSPEQLEAMGINR